MLKWYIDLSNKIAKSRKGASMVEYAIVLAVVAAIAVGVFGVMGNKVCSKAEKANSALG